MKVLLWWALAWGGEVDALFEALEVDETLRRELADQGRAYRYSRDGLGRDDVDGSFEAGISMRIVNGPPEAIWDQVQDCDAFVTYLPYVTGSVRSRFETTEVGATWDCAMELTTKGFVTRYTVHTVLHRSDGLAEFEMVEGSGSVLRSARGYWRTMAWPEGTDQTLLVYVFESRAAWWVPAFAKRMAADRGLSDITHLVGRQVEKKLAREAP